MTDRYGDEEENDFATPYLTLFCCPEDGDMIHSYFYINKQTSFSAEAEESTD